MGLTNLEDKFMFQEGLVRRDDGVPQGPVRPRIDSYGEMFRSRLLAERSRLEFHYPGSDGTIIFLPFYENPEITESQAASYAEYNPIARSGSMYAYLGAKSRKFKVDFYYTLPHLAFHEMGVSKFLRVFMQNSTEAKKAMFEPTGSHTLKERPGDASKSLGLAQERLYRYLRDLQDPITGVTITNQRRDQTVLVGNANGRIVSDTQLNEYLEFHVKPSEKVKVIDTLLFFMGVIRTSVTNKSNNPMLGPPIVRITHGTMYQSIPTVCRKYNISFDEEAGYHLQTLTPRRIKISMSLDEVRVGNFEDYKPTKLANRDNLTGWESAINSPHTTDPLPVEGFWESS